MAPHKIKVTKVQTITMLPLATVPMRCDSKLDICICFHFRVRISRTEYMYCMQAQLLG